MQRRVVVAGLVVASLVAVLAGTGVLLVVDFDDRDPGIDVERNPDPPDRPATLTAETVTGYAIAYEEQRLYNDILAAHSHHLQWNDTVVTVCREQSLTATGKGFLIELRCAGGIDNRVTPDRQESFAYTVAYRVTETTIEQVAIERFPYEERDTLRSHPVERDDDRSDDGTLSGDSTRSGDGSLSGDGTRSGDDARSSDSTPSSDDSFSLSPWDANA